MKTFNTTHSILAGMRFSALAAALTLALPTSAFADAKSGKTIAPLKQEVPYTFVVHQGRSIKIERDVFDSFKARNDIRASLLQNSEACPPFCFQPQQLDIPVETYGEAEVVDFMLTQLRDGSGVFVDVRSKQNYEGVTIPGSVNYFIQDVQKGPGDETFDNMLVEFGAQRHDGLNLGDKIKGYVGLADNSMKTNKWDFNDAQTLVFWAQSAVDPAAVQAIELMLEAGYPAQKLKWYRGGMASWQYWGFNTYKKPPRRR